MASKNVEVPPARQDNHGGKGGVGAGDAVDRGTAPRIAWSGRTTGNVQIYPAPTEAALVQKRDHRRSAPPERMNHRAISHETGAISPLQAKTISPNVCVNDLRRGTAPPAARSLVSGSNCAINAADREIIAPSVEKSAVRVNRRPNRRHCCGDRLCGWHMTACPQPMLVRGRTKSRVSDSHGHARAHPPECTLDASPTG